MLEQTDDPTNMTDLREEPYDGRDPDRPELVNVHDVNDDGYEDILSASEDDNIIRLHKNDGFSVDNI